ncbi:MAG TPA: hypothetical protein VH500_10995 [Nitrososphaeraceae archaeon]|jgi:hypothetical protein
MIKIMLLIQADIEEPSVCEMELRVIEVLKFVVTTKIISSFSMLSTNSELGNVYTGITPNASNTYPFLSVFDSWKNKSNVNPSVDRHELY